MDTTVIIGIIGALSALAGVIITTILGFLIWSRNIRFQILKDERDRLESKFETALTLLQTGIIEGTINARLAAMCNHEFPKDVREEFEQMVNDKVFSSTDESTKKQAYFSMAHAMSKAIQEYNVKIQETAEVVNKEFAVQLAKNIINSGLLKWHI